MRLWIPASAGMTGDAGATKKVVRHHIDLSPEEATRAETSIAGTLGRPWELWKRKALGR